MRVLFFGTASFAVPSLDRLVSAKHQIVCCVTQPERPQGRGLTARPSPIKTAALQHGLTVEEPHELHAFLPSAQRLQPDVGVVIAYGRLIPPEWLTLPRYGLVGVHPSLLPTYRGASPIARAILNGERTTGVTIFRLDERLDAGDVLLQREAPIEPQDTTESLSHRLAALGGELLVDALSGLEQGTVTAHPQDEQQASDAPKLSKTDGRIDWRADAASIDRLVRAATPWPGAYTSWRGHGMKIWATRCEVGASPPQRHPGEIVSVDAEGLAVATGGGYTTSRPLGRVWITANSFLSCLPVSSI